MNKLTSDHLFVLTFVFLGLMVISAFVGIANGSNNLVFGWSFVTFIVTLIAGYGCATVMSEMED